MNWIQAGCLAWPTEEAIPSKLFVVSVHNAEARLPPADLDDTIRRLTAFAEVGADVLYAPYPSDLDHVIAIVCAVAPKPVNLVVGTMQGPLSMEALAAAGIKRVSIGAGFYARVMGDLRKAARQLRDGDVPAATEGANWREIAALIAAVPV
ncbi:isocitrate lyase/phosphoenolpyruvate mutase family protein [Bacillus sp. NP157]|nr:isocitrate lyase/phosphoenolpyruvate mutase family protein [Bacillus sp. NP157]